MEHDNEFEREVKEALARVDAPEGFSEQVVARARKRYPRPATRFATPAWRGAYAAAAMLTVIMGTVHVHQVHEEERRAAEAQQQFARAMDLTGHALDRVAVQLQQGQFGQITSVFENGREER